LASYNNLSTARKKFPAGEEEHQGLGARVRRDICFEANISEYEANIYSLQNIKKVLFACFALKRILHVKQIKTETNILF
jgi:hypothetical protein